MCQKLATRRDGHQFPCGQCTNCKINKRRDWQSRLLLEAASHDYSAFVTLTFEDRGIRTILRRSDVHWFFRQLRVVHPNARHFTAGEYGSIFGRAHYHSVIFSDRPILDSHIRESWPFGSVDIGNVEPASLDYVLGYLLKQSKQIVWPVEERYPEFRSFSQGLGKFALPHLLLDGTQLPREFRVYGKKWPLGRYIRDRARKLGFTVSETESTRLERLETEYVRALLARPETTAEEAEMIYAGIVAGRQEKQKKIRDKAIRDAYKQLHGHIKGKSKHETF